MSETSAEIQAAIVVALEECTTQLEAIEGITPEMIGGAFFGATLAMMIQAGLTDEEIVAIAQREVVKLREHYNTLYPPT